MRDVIKYIEDPAAKSDYFEPLRQFLYTLPDQRRIEIPFTRSHWEGAEVALEPPLARGWLRQLDTGLHPIFYREGLNRLTYASWLADNAVRYVALPSAKPDKSSYGERALIEKGLPYLRLRWKSDDWRVYEVLLPAPLVIPQKDANIVLEQLQSDELLLDVKRPGEAIVKVRWTPYWFASNACVEPDGDWTRVIAERDGLRAPLHALLARAAVPARSPMRRLCDRLGCCRPCLARIRCTSSWSVSGDRPGAGCPAAGSTRSASSLSSPAPTTLYRIVRGFVDGQAGLAFENARALVDIERSLGLFFEPGLQAWAKSEEWLLTFANWMYVNSHFVVTTTFLIWLYLARNHAYYFVRNMFMVAMGLALVGLPGLPDRAAALPARVGLHRHGRELRRRGRREQRQRALQPVRRGAEHARGVCADDRHPGVHARQEPRAQGALGASTRSSSRSS